MFLFFKKRLFRRMIGYVDAIKLVVYGKLWPEFAKQYDQERAKQLAAAVVNRLFGNAASPMHANIPAALIDALATDLLQNTEDKDLLHGIVMSLRTLMTVETDARNPEAMNRIQDTVQWVKTIIPLPPEAPEPNMMERLAGMLQARYYQERPKIIIIVDDEDAIHILYDEEFKESFGDKVSLVHFLSAEEALEYLHSSHPNLIISDINMPRMNGIEFLGICKEKYPEIPFIISSAYQEFKNDLSTMACDAYVVQSANLTELINETKRLLSLK